MSETSRRWTILAGAGALLLLLPHPARALTRQVAEMQPVRLSFGHSVLNQLSYGTYRDPYDELQTRPENLLFANIGRHPVLGPWPGQQGNYTRYVNALIGNNGAANVDNDADAIQGSMIRRETGRLAWGVSAALLTGSLGNDAATGVTTSSDTDDLSGGDLRGALAWQVSEHMVLGGGLRVSKALSEVSDESFEAGLGGSIGVEEFDQLGVEGDFGIRHFFSPTSSIQGRILVGSGSATQDEFSEDLDAAGAVTDRFVIRNWDVDDTRLGLEASYNRLREEGLGETEYRAGVQQTERELGNSDLAFEVTGGGTTPNTVLLAQDPISTLRFFASARTVFQAGETEMFTGGEIAHETTDGSTTIDAAGTQVIEAIDDTRSIVGLTLGLRQPLMSDKLRFVISGHADLVRQDLATEFDAASSQDDSTLSVAQYAIGLEGVLANVTFDLAWVSGEEAAVVPVPLGIPGGSRRTVELDRLVFSGAVAW